MVSKEFIQALRILSQELKDIDWVLVGSMSLALQGVDIKPDSWGGNYKKND